MVKIGEPIKLAGFPNHGEGHSGIVAPGFVTGFRRDADKNELILISANIIAGNSGGPVFDASGKVIGVAVRGAKSQDEAQETEFHGVIPITVLSSLSPGTSRLAQAAAHEQAGSAEPPSER
jgi:S1-C subfamily serine protease